MLASSPGKTRRVISTPYSIRHKLEQNPKNGSHCTAILPLLTACPRSRHSQCQDVSGIAFRPHQPMLSNFRRLAYTIVLQLEDHSKKLSLTGNCTSHVTRILPLFRSLAQLNTRIQGKSSSSCSLALGLLDHARFSELDHFSSFSHCEIPWDPTVSYIEIRSCRGKLNFHVLQRSKDYLCRLWCGVMVN